MCVCVLYRSVILCFKHLQIVNASRFLLRPGQSLEARDLTRFELQDPLDPAPNNQHSLLQTLLGLADPILDPRPWTQDLGGRKTLDPRPWPQDPGQ